jgi:tetratricopeptide (TPR) repeat protein
MKTYQMQISLLILVMIFSFGRGLAQVAPDVARRADSAAKKAVEMMDNNLPESALEVWDVAIKLVPYYVPYKYEKAVCYVMAKKYQDAKDVLKGIYTDRTLGDRGYQLLGNCYDFLEDTAASFAVYSDGLIANPKSGRLHFEIGQRKYLQKDRKGAHEFWLKGTRAEPRYATNYYWLARSYSETRDRLWSALFGEAFLNLERNTQRTREISKLVYDMWNLSMRLGDTLDPINFCTEETLEVPDKRGPDVMNFPTAFEFTVAQASQPFIIKDSVIKGLSIEKLVDLRYRFTRAWISSGNDSLHTNDLLRWSMYLQKQGRLKEYLWWLYSYGDIREMNAYFKKNEERYDVFLVWFGENQLSFDKPLCLGLGCQ